MKKERRFPNPPLADYRDVLNLSRMLGIQKAEDFLEFFFAPDKVFRVGDFGSEEKRVWHGIPPWVGREALYPSCSL